MSWIISRSSTGSNPNSRSNSRKALSPLPPPEDEGAFGTGLVNFSESVAELFSLTRESSHENATRLGVVSWLDGPLHLLVEDGQSDNERSEQGRVWPATVRAQVQQQLSSCFPS
eukprot:6214010-Pleurochrysis_carterae.AAC.5